MSSGGSYFHHLAVRLSRRLSKGFLLSFDYSHSRLMEANSYPNSGEKRLEKRVSADDRPENFGISGLYELPFGRGKRFANRGGVVNVLVGNWQVSSMFNYHTGAPLSWSDVIYSGGKLNINPHNPDRTFDTTPFVTVSSQQYTNHYRTFPTYFNNLRVDSTNNLNISVTKDFALREKTKLQFRADSFNVCNHPLFPGADVSVTSSTFGRITSGQTNAPRVIQGALRLTF
jgi:hypothetical protein